MDWVSVLGLITLLVPALLAGGIWVSIALATVGCFILLINGYDLAPIASVFWTTTGNFVLVAVPLFILMGEIILTSGLSERFYRSVAPWARFLPGRLFSINIVVSGIFAAVSGSSVATAAAIGKIAIPELRKRGYDNRINYGSIAAGGTLGILIPPSAGMIVYGSLVGANIVKLFIAGIIPGLLLMMLFMMWVTLAPSLMKGAIPEHRESLRLRDLVRTLPGMIPILLLIGMVVGGIYGGYVTPTEAAALGVAGAVVIGTALGNLTLAKFWAAAVRSAIATAMIMFIVLGAQILSYALARTGTSRALVSWVLDMNLGAWQVFGVIVVIYLILGCFVDALSVMVLTLPLFFPLIVALGFDPIWFGIVLMMLIEVGLITPPVGLNLFVIHNFTGRDSAFGDIAIGALPFVGLMLLAILLLCLFPGLALWLPKQL